MNYRIRPNMPALGKRGLGKQIPALKKWLQEEADGAEIARVTARGESYAVPMLDEPLAPEDFLVETEAAEGFACAEDSGYLTELDTMLSDALIDEGVAREVVRSVQDARKQAGLEVSDRIVLGVSGSAAVVRALEFHRDYVMSETLATTWEVDQSAPLYAAERTLGDEYWTIEFSKA
jgi:isoleucyl-tRNA synthetase